MKTKMLKYCLSIALKNNNANNHPQWDCYKHYSFIVQDNKVLEWGTNRAGEAIVVLGYEPHQKIHSEVDAYRRAKHWLNNLNFEVVNIRLTKTNKVKASNPCKCCTAFLKSMGCRTIWFTTDTEMFARMGL